MRDTLRNASTGVKVSFAVIVLSIVVASFGLGALGTTLFLRAQSESHLREALIANCEGSPMKEAEIEDQREAITSADDPRLKRLLPDTPQTVIAEIVAEGNAKHRLRIKAIRGVDCAARYP